VQVQSLAVTVITDDDSTAKRTNVDGGIEIAQKQETCGCAQWFGYFEITTERTPGGNVSHDSELLWRTLCPILTLFDRVTTADRWVQSGRVVGTSALLK
jgi:hypothetical protein